MELNCIYIIINFFFTKDVEWISASLKLSRRRALAGWKQGRLQLILALPVLDLGCQNYHGDPVLTRIINKSKIYTT